MGDLREYRRRRDPRRTPEPVPAKDPPTGPGGDRFVIQEHHARRLHYDVRLERGGVLVCFAVPHNLPRQPGEVRLAVPTEDHPLEYLTFHGEIPKGEYGAGCLTIWDSGRYDTEQWTDDEIAVTLHGQRTRGRFVFFSPGKGQDWMVRRRSDPDTTPPRPTGAVHAPMVTVEGRRLTLSNLDKVLYPATGFSKGEVIDYYTRIAPVLLPCLTDRPVTLRRYPDGVTGTPHARCPGSHTMPRSRAVSGLTSSPGSTSAKDGMSVVSCSATSTRLSLSRWCAGTLKLLAARPAGRAHRPAA